MAGIQAPPPSAGVLGQGIKFPLTLTSNGRLALSWGVTAVEDAVKSIFLTQPGERPMLPGFGAGASTFDPIGAARTKEKGEQNMAEHEPRAKNVSVSTNLGVPGELICAVSFSVDNDATPRTLTFPLYTPAAITGASK